VEPWTSVARWPPRFPFPRNTNQTSPMRTAAPLAAAILTTVSLTAQRLVLPDNHNFMESPTYEVCAGDAFQWGVGARRFQIIYEASHFTGKNGVNSPVLITRIKFRGEDGEGNSGGQVYTNLNVEIGSTSVTAATMSTTFATNRLVATTTMGTLGIVPTLTVLPSTGGCPNSWCIDIDLLAVGAAFLFDPTSAQPNLLIDITAPTAPSQVAPQSMIPIQDTIAHGAGVRGRSIYTSTPAAVSGTSDTTPPVVGIEFAGAGGWATEVPALAEYIGGGCGGAHSTIYQSFQQGQPFDLGAGLTFVPDTYPAPNFYTVLPGAPAIDMTQLEAVPDTMSLDSLVTHTLGFSVTPFQYPGGGSTATVKPSTNGYVWLDAAMTVANHYNPTKATMLGSGGDFRARFLPYWTDGDPSRNNLNPLRGIHAKTVPETVPGAGDAVCYITWNDIGAFRTPAAHGHHSNTYQMVIHEQTGIVEFRYGPMMPFACTKWTSSMVETLVVGFTRGRISTTPLIASLDPMTRDLSHELPVSTAVEGSTSNVSLTAVVTPVPGTAHQTGRMFGGQSLKWNVANIPAGTIFASLNLDVGASQPGFQLPGLTAPGCMISTSLSPLVLGWETWVLPPASVTGAVTLVTPHGWEGTVITAQAIGIDVFGGPFLVPWSSNTIKYTVGLD